MSMADVSSIRLWRRGWRRLRWMEVELRFDMQHRPCPRLAPAAMPLGWRVSQCMAGVHSHTNAAASSDDGANARGQPVTHRAVRHCDEGARRTAAHRVGGQNSVASLSGSDVDDRESQIWTNARDRSGRPREVKRKVIAATQLQAMVARRAGDLPLIGPCALLLKSKPRPLVKRM